MRPRKEITPEEHAWYVATGKRLRRSREAKGISQRDFAEMIGVAPPLLNRFENGKAPLRLYAFVQACIILKKDMNGMCGIKGRVIYKDEM